MDISAKQVVVDEDKVYEYLGPKKYISDVALLIIVLF